MIVLNHHIMKFEGIVKDASRGFWYTMNGENILTIECRGQEIIMRDLSGDLTIGDKVEITFETNATIKKLS